MRRNAAVLVAVCLWVLPVALGCTRGDETPRASLPGSMRTEEAPKAASKPRIQRFCMGLDYIAYRGPFQRLPALMIVTGPYPARSDPHIAVPISPEEAEAVMAALDKCNAMARQDYPPPGVLPEGWWCFLRVTREGGAELYVYWHLGEEPDLAVPGPKRDIPQAMREALVGKPREQVDGYLADVSKRVSDAVAEKNTDGWRLLREVVSPGRKEAAEILIAKGADVNARTADGWTALHGAASLGRREIVDLLVARGADVNAREARGWTSLHNAIDLGSKAIAESLVAKGADVNLKNEAGQTPLHLAARAADKEIVELLVAKGADVNAKDKCGETPLYMAGSREIAEFLIAKGFDVKTKYGERQTPLHLMAWSGREEIAEFLIAKGADVNLKNEAGQTPLHLAAAFGQRVVAELLIAKGADVNARDVKGRTTLHEVARAGNKEIVGLLIAKGADLAARDNDGKTALQIAIANKHEAVAEILRKAGGTE